MSEEEIIKWLEEQDNIIYGTNLVKALTKLFKNFISKDKIKNKINEIKEIADNGANAVRFAMTYEDEIKRRERQKNISTMVEILEDLLKEN